MYVSTYYHTDSNRQILNCLALLNSWSRYGYANTLGQGGNSTFLQDIDITEWKVNID